MGEAMQRLLLCFLCLLFCATVVGRPPAAAVAPDDVAPEEKPPPPPVRQIYEVTGLVTEPSVDMESVTVLPPTEPGRRAPPTAGSQLAQQSREPATRTRRLEELVKLLEAMADPVTWRDNGGAEGDIKTYETQLVIIASAQTHAKLTEFLGELRRGRGRSVRLRAIWAALSEYELGSVLRPPEKVEGRTAVRIVDLPAVERLNGAVRFR